MSADTTELVIRHKLLLRGGALAALLALIAEIYEIDHLKAGHA